MSSEEFYSSYYANVDDRAWVWRELSGRIKAQNIVSVVGDISVQTVLDIGCGTGSVLAHLDKIKFGKSYWAVDITEESVKLIQERQDIPKLVQAQVFNGVSLPYKDKQFDLAILSHVVEHIDNPVPVIQEAARVAEWVVIEVPLEDNLHTHGKIKLFKDSYREQIGHVQWFNRRNIVRLIRDSCDLRLCVAKDVFLPDEVYYFRKQNVSHRLAITASLKIRACLRRISPELYSSLLTDHFICLAKADS